MKTNGRVSIQKLYDEIMPIVKNISSHTIELENIKDDIKEIKNDMKSKISVKAFSAWLGSLSIIFGIIITIISIVFLR